jgi:hypothetical protein
MFAPDYCIDRTQAKSRRKQKGKQTMKQTLNTYQIADALKNDEHACWSYEGSMALAKYLEELEDSIGEEMELDVVAIRCDFSEWESLEQWACDYFGTKYLIEACEQMGIDEDVAMSDDPEEIDEAIREYIQDNGELVEFEGGVIVSAF